MISGVIDWRFHAIFTLDFAKNSHFSYKSYTNVLLK